MDKKSGSANLIFIMFVAARVILFVSAPYQVIPGYGDYWNFYSQARLGIPYINYWTEFPPLFPFLSKFIYSLVGGHEVPFGYALAITISLFQAGTLFLSLKIAENILPEQEACERIWVNFALTIGLFYSWSYFDPIAVLFTILSIYWLINGKDIPAAAAITLGLLTKWFPILVLPLVWKTTDQKRAAAITGIVLGAGVLVWGGLYLLNPMMTQASLTSQINKGSWETIWAIVDNNITTGNFSAQVNRLIPASASLITGNPAVVPPWLTLILFGGVGLYLLIKSEIDSNLKSIAFVGLALVVFFLWSPGYSPQWVLYLVPFALIALDKNEAYLISAVFILVNLLEWPLLLSRGNFSSLYLLIPLRTAIMILLGTRFYQILFIHKLITKDHK